MVTRSFVDVPRVWRHCAISKKMRNAGMRVDVWRSFHVTMLFFRWTDMHVVDERFGNVSIASKRDQSRLFLRIAIICKCWDERNFSFPDLAEFKCGHNWMCRQRYAIVVISTVLQRKLLYFGFQNWSPSGVRAVMVFKIESQAVFEQWLFPTIISFK